MTERFLCIHGHFYQPPRENPLTGSIPREAGAEPYANYNEKINAECYRPNAVLGNFRRLSFDVGPTLTDWLARHDHGVMQRLVAADRWAVRHMGGGPALAQGYHHTILPLDSPRDQRTQISWGIRDFQFHFGRSPLGFWLSETAADLPTLEALAAAGIAFTILAPWQSDQAETRSGQPYRVALPAGQNITVFFYEGRLSGDISFRPELTIDAGRFVQEHLEPWYAVHGSELLLIASDGELYGHHQPFRDLFLHDLFGQRLGPAGIRPTTLESHLRRAAAVEPIRIREATSWSCFHGLERWRADCDCTSGSGHWKGELRTLLNWLRDEVDTATVDAAAGLLANPWRARDEYIDVILGLTRPRAWLTRHLTMRASSDQEERLLILMEAQRFRLAMYASCAFFWEDIDRIEPRNAIASAVQAARLVDKAVDARLETALRQRLVGLISPRTGRTAAQIVTDLER